MESQQRWILTCLALVVLVAGLSVEAFNQDRTIYKWSPLWFNNYYRRGNLYKRFRDEPIQKWSPNYFDNSFAYYYDKRDGSVCGRENSLCASESKLTGEILTVRCCGVLQCLPTGQAHTCTDPKTAELEDTGSLSNFDF
ncbi:uncharacterized protein [Palaemon carinicauda]|uniref:uncharacterized protein n=1 Tax=Palaemon carinicauda TaxID=392227 RepID=UPI0035B5F8A3